MTCQRCLERRQAIRDAWLKRNIAEAVKQAAIGVGEMVKGVDPAVAEKIPLWWDLHWQAIPCG